MRIEKPTKIEQMDKNLKQTKSKIYDSCSLEISDFKTGTENQFRQFAFSKSVLIKKRIISSAKKEGKRAFRVYPNWDSVTSKQAERTQKWLQNYFYQINSPTNLKK